MCAEQVSTDFWCCYWYEMIVLDGLKSQYQTVSAKFSEPMKRHCWVCCDSGRSSKVSGIKDFHKKQYMTYEHHWSRMWIRCWKNYLQNLRFEFDGHRLRHRLEFVDKLDACISSDSHHSVTLCQSLSFLVSQRCLRSRVCLIRLDAYLQRQRQLHLLPLSCRRRELSVAPNESIRNVIKKRVECRISFKDAPI